MSLVFGVQLLQRGEDVGRQFHGRLHDVVGRLGVIGIGD